MRPTTPASGRKPSNTGNRTSSPVVSRVDRAISTKPSNKDNAIWRSSAFERINVIIFTFSAHITFPNHQKYGDSTNVVTVRIPHYFTVWRIEESIKPRLGGVWHFWSLHIGNGYCQYSSKRRLDALSMPLRERVSPWRSIKIPKDKWKRACPHWYINIVDNSIVKILLRIHDLSKPNNATEIID